MKEKIKRLLSDKSLTAPVISYPYCRELGLTVKDVLTDAAAGARLLRFAAEKHPVGAVLNTMDLSVEAQCFGAEVRFPENEKGIPEVIGHVVTAVGDIADISVPPADTGRTRVFTQAIEAAVPLPGNKPLICGIVGPFSLAARLFEMSEMMMECFDSPGEIGSLLSKVTRFIIAYALRLKKAGADGILLCEPAAGLLSPDMAEEFSHPYVREIFAAVGDDDFILGYHNCGESVSRMGQGLASLGADIYHFGNAVDISAVIRDLPDGSVAMGNVDPVLLRDGTPEKVRGAVAEVFAKYGNYPNYMISTGCDVPFDVPAENISAYFAAVKDAYRAG